MVALSKDLWRWSASQILLSAALYTCVVLAFSSQSRTTTTYARGFAIPVSPTAKTLMQRCGGKAFRHQAILEKAGLHCGGDQAASPQASKAATTPLYEEEIRKFLASKNRGSSSTLLEQFHIQGWRWHTKSLARDAGRLRNLALKSSLKNSDTLKEASDYVVGFNLAGLHRIETSLFFPWMREKLTAGDSGKPSLSKVFASAMDALETDRQAVAKLGETIYKKSRVACDTTVPDPRRSDAIAELADHSAELQGLVERMISIEDTLLVPAIGAIVPVREQKSFNNKVLRKLGILDSRLHLVGMYETVWEHNDSKEKELFQQAIPGITRQLIPRWKRKLYQPKTYMME